MYRFSTNIPFVNWLKTNLRLSFPLHGIEEVVGSIPTRPTISFSAVFVRKRSRFHLAAPLD